MNKNNIGSVVIIKSNIDRDNDINNNYKPIDIITERDQIDCDCD